MNLWVRYTRQLARVAFGKVLAWRSLTVFPDDVFFVSYARSGSTWTRFLIGNLVYGGEPTTFLNVESRIPDIYVLPDRVLRKQPRPRILKSHETYDYRYNKIIYIVRDPRDVAVSLHHYDLKRRVVPEGYRVEDSVRRFVSGSRLIMGGWGEHVMSWWATRGGSDNFLLIRYEDMMESPEMELSKIASFLNIEASQQKLARAVELSSVDHMKKLEKEQSREWVGTKNTRQDITFVRRGRTGEWKSVLPEEAVLAIETAWPAVMESLGYELTTDAAKRKAASVLEAGLLPTPSARAAHQGVRIG